MKERGKALFLKRFDALVNAKKQETDPVVRVPRKDWHWVKPLTEEIDGVIRYRGVEIIVRDW